MHLFAAKLTGVAALKDVEKMKDYGAHKSISFVDGGYTSTAKHKGEIVSITKGAIDYLSQSKPDAIVIEFGDGLLGEYGVEEILKNADLQNNMAFHIGCAYDPLGAMKLVELCEAMGAPINMMSGPVTDNSVGVNFIEKTLKIPAVNALTQGEKLFRQMMKEMKKRKKI